MTYHSDHSDPLKFFVWVAMAVLGVAVLIGAGLLVMSVARSQTPTPPTPPQFQSFGIGTPSPVPLLPGIAGNTSMINAKDDSKLEWGTTSIGVTPFESMKKDK
jgi:hypothetical protein